METIRPVAALTFDDGPDDRHTVEILEALAERSATATFFMLARQAIRLPQVVRAVLEGGHEIGLHGYDHSPVIGISSLAKIRRIRDGKHRLEEVVGRPVLLYRPPFGWQDMRSYVATRSAGMNVVLWSAEGDDCEENATPEKAAEMAARRLQPGGILLLHDRCEPFPGRPDVRPAAGLDRRRMVEQIFARFEDLEFVSVGKLLRQGPPDVQPWFWRPIGSEAEGLLGR